MGRKRIGKHKTYRISDSDYKSFKEWCYSRGLRVNEVIRALIKKTSHITVKDLIFSDAKFEHYARNLLKKRKELKENE